MHLQDVLFFKLSGHVYEGCWNIVSVLLIEVHDGILCDTDTFSVNRITHLKIVTVKSSLAVGWC